MPRREILGQAMTDRSFRMPVARLTAARGEAAAATYCYRFEWLVGTTVLEGRLTNHAVVDEKVAAR